MSDDVMPESFYWIGLPMEHCATVGRIAVAAAWLEYEIAGLCAVLLGNEMRVTSAVTDGMTAGALIELAKRLLPTSPADEEARQPVPALLGKCKQALERRNTVLHGLVMGSAGSPVTILSRRGENKLTEWSLPELHEIADSLEYLGADVQEAADNLVVIHIRD